MVKSLSAKLMYLHQDEKGNDVLRARTVGRLSVNADNAALLQFGDAYGNLKGESYVAVDKVITEEVR